MNFCLTWKIFSLAIFLSLFTFLASGVAESFPFRTISVGKAVSDVSFTNVVDNSTFSISTLKGEPAILVFFGGGIETKKKRSIATLTVLQNLTSFLQEKKIALKVINIQEDSEAVIAGIVELSGLTAPVYSDPSQKAYGALGIYIMPSILVLDKDGLAVAGMGYNKDLSGMLKGEVEILLGEKTREQVNAELHPVIEEKSKDEKEGNRHLGMGHLLVKKGQLEQAEREFQAALSKNPKLAEAMIELGCLQFQLGNVESAQKNLDAAFEIDSESLRGEICFSQITAAQGDVDTAIEDLEAMLFRNGRNAELHYVLGGFYEKKADLPKAAKEYSKAYELLLRSRHLEE